MSLLKKSKYKASDMHFLLEAVPNPVNRPDLEDAQKQHAVLNKIRKFASDLFEPNPAVESNGDTRIFHTSQLYKKCSSVEELVQAMNEYDIVLRCNAIKDGGATAVQVTKDDLERAMKSSDRSVSIKAGINAQLRLMLSKSRNLHYITKLDYELN